MPWNGKRTKAALRVYHYLPDDALPIPYTLTDFGRAYLAQIKLKEELAARVASAQKANELPSLRQVTQSLRSRRKP